MKVFTSVASDGRTVSVPADKIMAVAVEQGGINQWGLTLYTEQRPITVAAGSQAFVTRQYDLLMDELCGGPATGKPGVRAPGYEHIVESEEL